MKMRLEDIRQQVRAAMDEEKRHIIEDALEAQDGEPLNLAGYPQRLWEAWPRLPYGELPKSLQVAVRQKVTPQAIRKAVCDMFGQGEFESLMQSYLAETCPQRDGESEAAYKKRCDGKVTQLLVKTRNAATYTIQGVINYALKPNDETGELEQVEVLLLDPELYGDHLMNAFEAQLWASHPQRAEGKEIARLVSGGARQMIISDKEYSHALVPDQNGTAYIGKMTPELFDYVRSQDSFSPIDDIGGYSTSYDDIKDLDLPLLQQIYTAAVESGISGDGVVLRVDFKKFCRHMGKDVDAGGSQDVLGDINKFAGYVGIRPGTRKIQVLLVFMGYDKDTDTLDLGVPYMFSIMSEVARKNLIQGKKKTGEQFEYEKPHYNKLCHSTINKERNKAAVMLVYEITNGLLQRGSDSNGEERVTYRVKFRTLVNAVPQLRGRIIDRKTTSDKNKELKRAFEAAYRILEKRTDALQYFEGLEYEKTVPTMTTLDSKLVITFKGINRDFEPLQ